MIAVKTRPLGARLSSAGKTLPSGQDSPQRGEMSPKVTEWGEEEMSPQGDREEGGQVVEQSACKAPLWSKGELSAKLTEGIDNENSNPLRHGLRRATSP